MSASIAKQVAAEKALSLLRSRLVEATRIGVGTGSTVAKIVELMMNDPELSRILKTRRVYASSLATLLLLRKHGVEAYNHAPPGGLDVYFDGADEVAIDATVCMLVKGRGAAMVREKILAYNSRYTLIVVDESKVSKNLGEKSKPVPVEVLEYALEPLLDELNFRGVRVEVRSNCSCRDGPALSDNAGIVVDTWPWGVMTPQKYETLLDTLPGIVGHGLFIGYADAVIIGHSNGKAMVHDCKRTRRNPTL